MLPDLIRRVETAALGKTRSHLPGLHLFHQTRPQHFEAMVYEPMVCLILQGAKHLVVGGEELMARAGELVLASHPTPVVARVAEASPAVPYLSLVVMLDLTELRALDGALDLPAPPSSSPRAFTVSQAEAPVLEVLGRTLDLAQDSADAEVLGPLLRRELHWRLLRSGCGGVLRQLTRTDSHASRIAQAVQTLRRDFRERLEMDLVARSVGMSASAFYKHFKATTATTPLQFQKDLRLTEARRLLLGGDHSVSTAAYAVGYESPSQFSREYGRKFGVPPRSDRPTGGAAAR